MSSRPQALSPNPTDTQPLPPHEDDRLVSGWGGFPATRGRVRTVDEAAGVAAALAEAIARSSQVIGRGLGRSYGDAAQRAGGTVIDCTGAKRILSFDPATGVVEAEAGLSLDELLRWSVPQGWFVPVSPGTRQVTLGGALAADVHGKNHHLDGSFARWVGRFRLATPTGLVEVEPARDADVFWATAGGMGLTGLVLDLSVRLLPIETSAMVVDTERASDLDDCMARMESGDAGYRYSVAWLDCLARGRHLGRSVLTRGDHAGLEALAATRRGLGGRPGRPTASAPLAYGPKELVTVPLTPPLRLLSRAGVAAFNETWFRKAPRERRGELQSIATFFHPLDAVRRWNRLYGPRGFTQYQFVVPFGAERALRDIVGALSARQVPSFLTVLKRFGPGDSGHLSFPTSGWTLAVDIPLGLSELGELLDGFDEQVAAAGGRVYLAKDGRLRPELFELMYPRLGEWRQVCDRLDPAGILSSDLSERLALRRPRGRAGIAACARVGDGVGAGVGADRTAPEVTAG